MAARRQTSKKVISSPLFEGLPPPPELVYQRSKDQTINLFGVCLIINRPYNGWRTEIIKLSATIPITNGHRKITLWSLYRHYRKRHMGTHAAMYRAIAESSVWLLIDKQERT